MLKETWEEPEAVGDVISYVLAMREKLATMTVLVQNKIRGPKQYRKHGMTRQLVRSTSERAAKYSSCYPHLLISCRHSGRALIKSSRGGVKLIMS